MNKSRTYVYYIRSGIEDNNRILGSVAFRPNKDGTVNRGIAVTGMKENGGRSIGRKIALNRLEISAGDKESSREINFRRDACARFALHFEGVRQQLHKCGFHVSPTPFEKRITQSASGA